MCYQQLAQGLVQKDAQKTQAAVQTDATCGMLQKFLFSFHMSGSSALTSKIVFKSSYQSTQGRGTAAPQCCWNWAWKKDEGQWPAHCL